MSDNVIPMRHRPYADDFTRVMAEGGITPHACIPPERDEADSCAKCGRHPLDWPDRAMSACTNCGQWDGNVTDDPWHCMACGSCLQMVGPAGVVW